VHRRELLPWLGLAVRLTAAAIWLFAGITKLSDLDGFRAQVDAYQVLPHVLVSPFSYGLPLVEVAIGGYLLVGAMVRPTAILACVLMVIFLVAEAQAWARGLSIDCGCFGNGGAIGAAQTRYPQEIARDVGLLLCAVWLAIRPHSAYNLDGVLFPAAAPARPEPHEGHRA